jgi:RimJ/RimL family protein N-acetyltransferase
VLRHAASDDLAYFASLHEDEEGSRFIGGRMGKEASWRRAMGGTGMWGVLGIGLWVMERRQDRRAIGHVGFFDFQRDIDPPIAGEPEMAWVLLREAQGQGLAGEATRAALEWFDEAFEGNSIAAIISIGNTRSMGLAERLGFERQADRNYRGEPIGFFQRRPPRAR